MKKYGKINNGVWPIMSDNSSMRFIPITQGYVKDNENRKKLFMHLKYQAASKAGEIKMPFKFKDIKDKKEYLQGESIEKLIHGWKSKKDDNIPVFKHITTRWSFKEEIMDYEIAVSSSMVEEAMEALKGFKTWLIKKYGNNVRNHFIDSTYKNEKTWKTMPQKRHINKINDWDDDVENFLQDTNTDDKISKVLIEGMEQLVQQENKYNGEKGDNKGNKQQAQEKKEKEKNVEEEREVIEVDKESDKNEKNEKNEKNKVRNDTDTVTELSECDSYIQQKAWDEISIMGEYNSCVQAISDERRKVFNTLDKMKIELAEVEQWKNREWTQLKSIVRECNQKEYSIMKRIVGAITLERDKNATSNNNGNDNEINAKETGNNNMKNISNQRSSRPPPSESLPQKNNECKERGS